MRTLTQRISVGLGIIGIVVSAAVWHLQAQVQVVVAYCYLDPGQIGGALQPNPTGWDWYMVCAYNDPNTGKKSVVSGVHASTLNADTLVQVDTKLATAAKDDAVTRGITPTLVLLPSVAFSVPQ